MQKTIKLAVFLSVLISIFYLSGCKKDDFDFRKINTKSEIGPGYSVPLAYGNMSMWDVIRDYDSARLFVQDQYGFLYVMYNAAFSKINLGDKFGIGSQSFSHSYTNDNAITDFDFGLPIPQKKDSAVYSFGFNPSDSEIDSAWIRTADLKIRLNSTFQHPLNLILTFPTIKKSNGSVYSKTVRITNPSVSGIADSVFTDLAGCRIDFTKDKFSPPYTTTFNKIPVLYSLSFSKNPSATTNLGNISLNVDVENVKHKTLFGYFGMQEHEIISAQDSVSLKLFADAFEGDFYFEDPRIIIKIHNSIGVPVRFYFTDLKSISQITGQRHSITGPGVPLPNNPKDVAYPSFGQYNVTKFDSIKFDRTTSNINTAIGSSPKYFAFGAKIITNPFYSHNNFVEDNDSIMANVEVQLPLWGWAHYTTADTESFNFSQFYHDYHGNILKKATVRITSENSFPIEAAIQLYFVNYDSLRPAIDRYRIVEKLVDFSPPVIVPAGTTDSYGKVISSKSLIRDVVIDEAKLRKMYDMKITHVIIQGKFGTDSYTTKKLVKIYSDCRLSVKAGMQLEFGLNTETLENY